jgi:hypothetical protein
VVVNGTWRGRTPLTLAKLPFGDYTVRVVQTGYQPRTQKVALSASTAARDLSFMLDPEPAAKRGNETARPVAKGPATKAPAPVVFIGSLLIDSHPRGARVFIDGREIGVTPLRVAEVKVGSHVVRFELASYRTVTSLARVVAGQEERLAVSLEKMPTP